MNTEVLILVMWVCSVWYPQLVTSQRCRDGYQLSPEFVCVDTDECETYGDPALITALCGSYTLCHNVPGSYYCTCQQGYVSPSGTTNFTQSTECEDINECQSSPCGSNATCHNTEGGFLCVCDKGFVSSTGTASFNTTMNYCKDRDECESSPCGSNETCHNTEGSFHCTFDPGSASRNNTTNHSEDVSQIGFILI
ncbi:adhesion G protein-coupled receptor E1-like [Callorhinchus milii]|uniref:adhesion G protein-coupled receptor E1-like n=1 Tax=Callorhinchus milii TaxID=7868 RepID=UPI001C3F9F6D|nr:adhesion G protein-coupled receptor E1-like [Callorhinchus milii]